MTREDPMRDSFVLTFRTSSLGKAIKEAEMAVTSWAPYGFVPFSRSWARDRPGLAAVLLYGFFAGGAMDGTLTVTFHRTGCVGCRVCSGTESGSTMGG